MTFAPGKFVCPVVLLLAFPMLAGIGQVRAGSISVEDLCRADLAPIADRLCAQANSAYEPAPVGAGSQATDPSTTRSTTPDLFVTAELCLYLDNSAVQTQQSTGGAGGTTTAPGSGTSAQAGSPAVRAEAPRALLVDFLFFERFIRPPNPILAGLFRPPREVA